MNPRFALLALSIAIAVFTLALFISVVGGSGSNATDEKIGIEEEAAMKIGPGILVPSDQKPDISQEEVLFLTEPISIYLPLMENEQVNYSTERAALMAIYHSTNGEDWENHSGWGTDSSHCNWDGVYCGEYDQVIDLSLDQNRLTGTIPPEIGNLVNLQGLDLNFNQLTSLPPEIGSLVNLGRLGLSGNQISSLPPEIGNLANLQILVLIGMQLTSLPPEIGNLDNLQRLSLFSNQVRFLPPEIGNLESLQWLDLGYNELTSLPPEIGSLENLGELYLSYNQLTSLPPEIGNLANLQTLSLYANRLTSLPPEIGNLKNLQILWLSFNQLKFLPAEIGNLENLQRLYVADNQLSGTIPAFLSYLKNLGGLDLINNPDLTCWETQEARDWAVSIAYTGPTCFFP